MLTQDQCDPDKPEEAFAWMFAAGVPDPRTSAQPDKKFRNQPLIPPPCFSALSKLLWDFGCRFDPDKQTKWIAPGKGPTSNFMVWDTTDKRPDAPAPASDAEQMAHAAAMVADQFPDVAARVAGATPETHRAALREQAQALLDSIDRLKAAQTQLEAQNAAHAAIQGGVSGGPT